MMAVKLVKTKGVNRSNLKGKMNSSNNVIKKSVSRKTAPVTVVTKQLKGKSSKVVQKMSTGTKVNIKSGVAKAKSKTNKVIPIIETRCMKVKRALEQLNLDAEKELKDLNNIDTLSSFEIAAGDKIDDEREIHHDGVDLSIDGSDFEEEGNLSNHWRSDEGMVSDSDGEAGKDNESDSPRRIKSKVVRVSKSPRRSSSEKKNKYAHLKDDPEFRECQNLLEEAALKRKISMLTLKTILNLGSF